MTICLTAARRPTKTLRANYRSYFDQTIYYRLKGNIGSALVDISDKTNGEHGCPAAEACAVHFLVSKLFYFTGHPFLAIFF